MAERTDAPYRAPWLGDPPAAFQRYFGYPSRRTDDGVVQLHQYRTAGHTVVAAFVQGRAVALHGPSCLARWPSGAYAPALFAAAEAPPTFWLGDGGWTVATRSCPVALIRAVSTSR